MNRHKDTLPQTNLIHLTEYFVILAWNTVILGYSESNVKDTLFKTYSQSINF